MLNDLARKCLEGNQKAQYELYQKLAPKMLGVCMRYASDQPQAEDFMQEGFVRTFTKLNQFNFEGSFEGWVRRIMVNTSLELLRKEMKRRYHDDIEGEGLDLAGDDDILSQLNANEMIEVVQSLPPKYRAVFNMYAFEGYKHSEIAKELGISEGTSKSNLSDARRWLRKRVSNLFGVKR